MSEEINEALLVFMKKYFDSKCAPYDWSFDAQKAYDKLIKALEADIEGDL